MTTEIIKYYLSRIVGNLYIPPELVNSKENKILHISDTPSCIYPVINNLLESINPDIIIHTGDLADEIKLEYNPSCVNTYAKLVRPFVQMLEGSHAQGVYIVPGNHDNMDVMSECVVRSIIVEEGNILETQYGILGLAHRFNKLPQGAKLNLYGHNFTLADENNKTVFLNGLININVILFPSENVVTIPYPMGTNYHRKMDDEYGLPNSI